MKLVHTATGEVVYINPAHIVKATRKDGITHIVFDNGDLINIKETIGEVFRE